MVVGRSLEIWFTEMDLAWSEVSLGSSGMAMVVVQYQPEQKSFEKVDCKFIRRAGGLITAFLNKQSDVLNTRYWYYILKI